MKIIANFFAVLLLIAILSTPILFARNFAKVAGVKSQSQFLIISQIEKFPNMKFTQEDNTYQISFTKQGASQAYLAVLILNNPTNRSQTYRLQTVSGLAKLFFGEDLNNQLPTITVPASASVPISLFSNQGSTTQTVEFTIIAE